jgi:hypothetical protein
MTTLAKQNRAVLIDAIDAAALKKNKRHTCGSAQHLRTLLIRMG